jgi:hypothetical protein
VHITEHAAQPLPTLATWQISQSSAGLTIAAHVQQEVIDKAVAALACTESEARIALRHYRWNFDRLMGAFIAMLQLQTLPRGIVQRALRCLTPSAVVHPW